MRLLASFLLLGLLVFAQEPSKTPVTQSQPTPQQSPSNEVSTPQSTSAPASQQPTPSQSNLPGSSSVSDTSATSGQAVTHAAQSRRAPVLKVTTRLVLVDVVVTDNSGRPVTDLKQTDFEVRENGKPQKVVAFAFQPPPTVESNEYKPFALSPGVYTNVRNINGQVGPPTILLIDGLNTPFKDQLYMRQQLVKYLQHVEPGRNLAIYTLGTRLRMVQDFTSDPYLLHKALEQITLQSSMFNQEREFEDEFPGLDPGSPDEHIAHMAHSLQTFEFEQQLFLQRSRFRMTLDAMKELAHNLAGYPGRKNLVWVSGAFPITIFPDETSRNPFHVQQHYGDDFRQTAAVFSNEQIAVYPVDPRGLVADFLPDASQRGSSLAGSRGGINAVRMAQQKSFELRATHDTMNELASQTGGRAFYNRNDIDRAIALSVAEGSTYYTLTYYPENKTPDGTFRKLEIKLDRKGLQAHYRKGYFATDVHPPDEKTARTEFLRALAPDAPITTALSFLVRVTLPDKEHKEVSLDFSVVPTAISFEPQGELEHAEVEFLTRIYDLKGKPVGSTEPTILSTQLKPETYKQVMTYGLRYHQMMNLQPGKYVLKMGVRDHRSNAIGTVVAKLDVPQP